MTAQNISLIGLLIFTVIILAFAFIVLWKIWTDELPLKGLLTELSPPGSPPSDAKASLSRFQMLIFTFVIATLFTMLSIQAHGFVQIPDNVLGPALR